MTVTTMTTARRILRAREIHAGDRDQRAMALHVLMTGILAETAEPLSDQDLRICGFSAAEIDDLAPGARLAAAETRALAAPEAST